MSDVKTSMLKELEKQFGADVLISGSAIVDKKSEIFSISPAIDVGLGGGVPGGSWVTLAGPAKYGKTHTALTLLRNMQRAGREIYIGSVEGRLKSRDLLSVHGLDVSKVHVIQSTPDKILSAQDFLTIFEKILTTVPGCGLLIDSYSALCHAKEIEEGVGTSTRGGGAMLLAQFTRQMGNVVPVMNSVVVGVTHIMANTSGYGLSWQEKGGNAIAYQVDVKMRATKREYLLNKDNKATGQKITWLIESTALSGTPSTTVESYLRYGYGLDATMELIDLGESLGLIEQNGSWYQLAYMAKHGEKECKAQGKEKLYQTLISHEDWLGKLESEIKEMLV